MGVLLSKNYDAKLLDKIFAEVVAKHGRIEPAIPAYLLKLCMFTDNRKLFAEFRKLQINFERKQFPVYIQEIFEAFLKHRPKFKNNMFANICDVISEKSDLSLIDTAFDQAVLGNHYMPEILQIAGIEQELREKLVADNGNTILHRLCKDKRFQH